MLFIKRKMPLANGGFTLDKKVFHSDVKIII